MVGAAAKADGRAGGGPRWILTSSSRRWRTATQHVPTSITVWAGEQQMAVLTQALLCLPDGAPIDELSLAWAPTVGLRAGPRCGAAAWWRDGMMVVCGGAARSMSPLRLAERAVFMERGRVRFNGPVCELSGRSDPVACRVRGRRRAGGARVIGTCRRAGSVSDPAVGRVRLQGGDLPDVVTMLRPVGRLSSGVRSTAQPSGVRRRRGVEELRRGGCLRDVSLSWWGQAKSWA